MAMGGREWGLLCTADGCVPSKFEVGMGILAKWAHGQQYLLVRSGLNPLAIGVKVSP